jgi:gamma-glutamylcyclotransferase (GGCT)/AIG2-like uncharacterized protein YtfP
MSRKQYLFAYGTLRRNHYPAFLERMDLDLQFVGQGGIKGFLYDLGDYPGAVKNKSGKTIRGDVFLLNDPESALSILDQYEGCSAVGGGQPEFFRKRNRVSLRSGNTVLAWVYWLTKNPAGKIRIKGPDYLAYQRNKI